MKILTMKKQRGSALIMSIGVVVTGLMMGVLAVDVPAYYAAQNQLQTAVDAAALAGAYKLPEGEQEAEWAAEEIAAENPVAGQQLNSGDLEFQYTLGDNMSMVVNGSKTVPTIFGRFVCALSGGGESDLDLEDGGDAGSDSGGAAGGNCNFMTVYASAKATPAARDTIIVIDSSSSMYGSPINNVKVAAQYFVDEVDNLTTQTGAIDRIGVVSFDAYGYEELELTSKSDYGDNGFYYVKESIDDITLWGGGGWNTNYSAGLEKALDELEENGRKNAKQTIIFLTDGVPNLPSPPSFGNPTSAINTCINIVNNSDAVQDLGYWYYSHRRWRWYQPYFPNDYPNPITDNVVEQSGGHDCGVEYTDYMVGQAQNQADRAEALGVTIHTIQMYDNADVGSGTTMRYFRSLLGDDEWESDLLAYFAGETDGEMYASADADLAELEAIYSTIAQDVKVKLASK